jgi:hypothetical protein
MPGIPQVTRTGPRTYVPASGVSVLAGQLVEARAGGRIGPAAAGSTVCLGVALQDAIAPEDLVTTAATVGNRSVLNTAVLPQNVAVAYGGVEVQVTYAAAATFGQSLIAAANGQVTPAGATPDARTLVGICTAPGGVGIGAVGLMRITVV